MYNFQRNEILKDIDTKYFAGWNFVPQKTDFVWEGITDVL